MELQGKSGGKVQAKQLPVKLSAVHGRMVHILTGAEFLQESPTKVDEVDDWLKAQIDAGKIRVVA